MNRYTTNFLVLLTFLLFFSCQKNSTQFFKADDALIRYTGRIDFSNPQQPRFWQPGVYIEAAFEGPACEFIVHDQELWGSHHNYLEVIVDDTILHRLQTTGATDTVRVASGLSEGKHKITICKNTEANIGWLEFGGFICKKLLPLPPSPQRKMEFFGNSITCGTGADATEIPCGTRDWHDQHNAWLSYGPRTARALDAQWHISAVSGIGMIHSCCEMDVLMPQVFDNIEMRNDSLDWDFKKYQPDVVTICLGQNDGVQDSVAFCGAYVQFIETLRSRYPEAQIVCLTSPMADGTLMPVLKNYLTGIVDFMNEKGDSKVDKFFFSRQFASGCDTHPDLEEHGLIAEELTGFLKGKMRW